MLNASPVVAPDASAASAALQRLEPRLSQLPADRLLAPRGDARLTAMAALGVADKLASPEVRARFLRLPKEEFDPQHLDVLRDAAWAAWHARSQLDAALSAPAEAPLPPAMVESGVALRERMLKVLRYWFEDDAELARQLNPIGRRKTNAELGPDLGRLSKLYRERKQTLQADIKFYREADADEAEKIAAEAAQLAGARRAEAEKRGGELVARTCTLLMSVYGEIRAAGLYLFRRENASEMFPDLSSMPAARGRPRKGVNGSAPVSEPPPAAPPSPAEPPPA